MNKNNIFLGVVFIILTLCSVSYALNDVLLESWVTILAAIVIGSIFMLVTNFGSSRIKGFNPPKDKVELFREDNALIKYTIFLQATLFFALEIILDEIINIRFFKGLILFATLLFVSMRTIAYIKDDGKWRLNSIKYTLYLIFAELVVLLSPTLNTYIPILSNERTFGLALIFFAAFLSSVTEIIGAFFAPRYV